MFVEQRDRDGARVGISPVERRPPDAGRPCDIGHGDRARIALGEYALGGLQHLGPVLRRVGPFAKLRIFKKVGRCIGRPATSPTGASALDHAANLRGNYVDVTSTFG